MLGASVRALAESATRFGWTVHAADLFGDVDLVRAAAGWRRVDAYPGGLADAAAAFPPAAWCYTGAVENHLAVIDAIAACRPLAGNAATAVRRVRDPAILGAALRAAGLHFPETRTTPAGLATDGSFLVKPRASAGGRGIARWTAALAQMHRFAEPAANPRVWQKFVAGEPLAAAYVMQQGCGILVGVSRQLVGEPWCLARPYAYCGSIAMRIDDLADTAREQLARLGTALAEGFGLVGLVGVDLVIDAAGAVTTVEVNPRPTASMELIERAGGGSIAGLHLAACGFAAPPTAACRPDAEGCWSKAVLFAPRGVAVDERLLDAVAAVAEPWTKDDGWPAIADIPQPGQTIASGSPVITLFSRGNSADDCRKQLIDRALVIRRILFSDDLDSRS